MEVILLQDVKNLGPKNSLVTVKDGYANNYLIPKKLAVIATPSRKKVLAETLRQQENKEQKLIKEAVTLKKKLLETKLKIYTKVSPKGKIYGSITNIQLAEALKKQYNIDIDRKKIEIESGIKEVGSYKATISLYKDIAVECEFEVLPEELNE